jgi:hypothetical protein
MKRSTPFSTPKFPKRHGSSTTSWTTIPKPTDVLSYAYLWHREAQEGRDEASKDRPVVVVVATRQRPHGTQIMVAPLTTRPPRPGDPALEVPAAVRRHLGLGDERSWIIANEYNLFTWPGPDIRPVLRSGDSTPRYGAIPGKLFEQLRQMMLRAARGGSLKETKRSN